MHIEVLVEDSSGKVLLDHLIPKILGPLGEPHTWRTISYKGVGRIPKNLNPKADPQKRILLDRLPKILQGYGNSYGIDGVVVLVDSDKRDCKKFLKELSDLVNKCQRRPRTLLRLAIEEIEAWYFGDRETLLHVYPRARRRVLESYIQDSVCGTWEVLADAVHLGGSEAIRKVGWPQSGQVKYEWAEAIGPQMDVDRNVSPSFGKFRDGLRTFVNNR